MAKIELISGEYSSHLDGLAQWVKRYADSNLDPKARERLNKAVQDFTFNNSSSFKRDFAKAAGLEGIPTAKIKPNGDSPSVDQFVEKLAEIEGECIFLLRDTQIALEKYTAKTGKGLGIIMNRYYCCRKEEDYFALTGLLYSALDEAESPASVAGIYIRKFTQLIAADDHFRQKSLEIANYVAEHVDATKPIVFVDYGFQFTFALFCLASLVVHRPESNKVDYYAYSVYPWVTEIFKGKYFTEHSQAVLDYELEGIKRFKETFSNKAKGTIAGFAIGDALGFPIAGIEKKDISQFLNQEVTGFEQNTQHPYFSHLRFGQYTDNTTALIIAGQNILKNGGFSVNSYETDLIEWGKDLLSDEKKQRWVGPTMISGIKKLIEGKSYSESGSVSTESCSSTYRVVPLAVFYRPFTRVDFGKLTEYARISGGITHNSEISKAGTTFVALLIADLLNGLQPQRAVEITLSRIAWDETNNKLRAKLFEAIQMSRTASVEEARTYFGTGSPIYQTLPLAVFYFLKFQDDFEKGALSAANSAREDTKEERERLEGMTFEEQLIEARGGNADGIAALTGAFLGAHLGDSAIPQRFKKIENYEGLIDLAEKLIA